MLTKHSWLVLNFSNDYKILSNLSRNQATDPLFAFSFCFRKRSLIFISSLFNSLSSLGRKFGSENALHATITSLSFSNSFPKLSSSYFLKGQRNSCLLTECMFLKYFPQNLHDCMFIVCM